MHFLRKHLRPFTRSAVVGLTSVLGELAILPVLIYALGVEHWVAYAVIQVVGQLITFVLNKYWAFEAGHVGRIHQQGAKSMFVFVGSYALNIALPSFGSYVLGGEPVAMFLIAQVLVWATWNYPFNLYWVFRDDRGSSVAAQRQIAR